MAGTIPIPIEFTAASSLAKVTFALGAVDVSTGFTFAACIKLKSLAQWHTLVSVETSTDTGCVGLYINSDDYSAIWIDDTFSGPVLTDLVSGEWYIIVGSKPSGTAATRQAQYRVSTTTWTKGTGASQADSARTENRIQLGEEHADSSPANMYGAVWGIWNRDLSEAEEETLPNSLDAWQTLAPDWWTIANGDTAMIDETGGTGDETARQADVDAAPGETSPIQWITAEKQTFYYPRRSYIRR